MKIKTYKLYLKESPKGLKYLGKTIRNPYSYMGSGTYWVSHLKKYNISSDDIKTTVLFETTDKDEFKKVAIEYSDKYNIVESKEFANLTSEEGQGGTTVTKETHSYIFEALSSAQKKSWKTDTDRRISASERMKNDNPSKRKDVREKLSKIKTGTKFSDEVNKKKGRSGDLNVSKRPDVRKKISESLKGRKLSQETKDKIRNSILIRNKNKNPK